MRWIPAIITLGLVACSSDSDVSSPSAFFTGDGDILGGVTALREGGPLSLGEMYTKADAVLVGTVVGVAGKEFADPVGIPGSEQLDAYLAVVPSYTTHKVKVEQWVKGRDGNEVMVQGLGGIDPYNGLPVGYVDGDLFLEVGHTYVMFLAKSANIYGRHFMARGTFHVAEDVVQVMNHPTTRDLEQFEGMALETFVQQLRAGS